MQGHRIRKYSTIKIVDGKKAALAAFSCGPCQAYAKFYRTSEAREKAIAEHVKEPVHV